jgi:hypothetical protein
MPADQLIGAVWAVGLVILVLVIVISRRARRHGGSFRAGVVGSIYDMQNQDKQRALDVIVEGKAAETRPEYPDGDLPQLENPNRKKQRSGRDG